MHVSEWDSEKLILLIFFTYICSMTSFKKTPSQRSLNSKARPFRNVSTCKVEKVRCDFDSTWYKIIMRCNKWVLKDTYPQHEGCFHKINSGSHSIYKPAWSCIICSISNNAEDIPLRNEIFLNCGSDSITFKLKPTHNLTTYSLTLVHHSVSLAIKSDPKYRLTIPCN